MNEEFGFKRISFKQISSRFISINLFISLENDNLKNKQYLINLSRSTGFLEVIDVENNINYGRDVKYFFDISNEIFSYQFSLFEIENSNKYIAVFFVERNKESTSSKQNLVIKKFQIKGLNYESDPQIQNEIIKTETIEAYYSRSVSAFRLDIPKLIVVVYIHSNGNLYLIRFYNDNLEIKENSGHDFILEDNVVNDNSMKINFL